MKSFNIPTNIKMTESLDEFVTLISDKDLLITNAPIFAPLKKYNLECKVIFQENYGQGELSKEMITAIINDIKEFEYENIFAVGGGTIIDLGKATALDGSENMDRLLQGEAPLRKKNKLIAVPTTCGTGSEVSNISIIEDGNTKKSLVGQAVFPDEAILTPELLFTLPYHMFLLSSLDALITAAESFVAPRSNDITSIFAEGSMRRILGAYNVIISRGKEVQNEVVGDALIASNFSGMAFVNTGVGAVHALSYSLGGKYHIPHGEAVYVFFIAVLEKYEELLPDGCIRQLKKVIADVLKCDEKEAFKYLGDILNKIIPLKKMGDCGAMKSDIKQFTHEVVNLERLMKNNYVKLNENDISDILEKCL